MPISKAQAKATQRYMAKAYDRVAFIVPKGERDILKAYAADRGESLNGFISRAIAETIERDKGGD